MHVTPCFSYSKGQGEKKLIWSVLLRYWSHFSLPDSFVMLQTSFSCTVLHLFEDVHRYSWLGNQCRDTGEMTSPVVYGMGGYLVSPVNSILSYLARIHCSLSKLWCKFRQKKQKQSKAKHLLRHGKQCPSKTLQHSLLERKMRYFDFVMSITSSLFFLSDR